VARSRLPNGKVDEEGTVFAKCPAGTILTGGGIRMTQRMCTEPVLKNGEVLTRRVPCVDYWNQVKTSGTSLAKPNEWQCSAGPDGRGSVTCVARCCAFGQSNRLKQILNEKGDGAIGKCGKLKRHPLTCRSKFGVGIVREECVGHEDCDAPTKPQSYPDVATCTGKKSLVTTLVCKAGDMRAKCKPEMDCPMTCKEPYKQAYDCLDRFVWRKKEGCVDASKDDPKCWFKDFTGDKDCKYKTVCGDGSICKKRKEILAQYNKRCVDNESPDLDGPGLTKLIKTQPATMRLAIEAEFKQRPIVSKGDLSKKVQAGINKAEGKTELGKLKNKIGSILKKAVDKLVKKKIPKVRTICANHKWLAASDYCGTTMDSSSNPKPCSYHQHNHSLSMGDEFQLDRIHVHLDATFPNSVPAIRSKHRGHTGKGGPGQLDLRVRKTDKCKFPFLNKKSGEWHWGCVEVGNPQPAHPPS
jgi:hypothetical protein